MMGIVTQACRRRAMDAEHNSGTLEQLFTEVSRGPKRESAMREVGLDGLIMLRWTT
jgi:hypothetical protein